MKQQDDMFLDILNTIWVGSWLGIMMGIMTWSLGVSALFACLGGASGTAAFIYANPASLCSWCNWILNPVISFFSGFCEAINR